MFFLKKNLSLKFGFTLVEVLVVVVIFTLVLGAIYGVYHLSEKAYREGERVAEITQNGRVILERLTREVRQSRTMVTVLAEDRQGATSTIMFEDGHRAERFHYIRYFQRENLVERKVIGFYFSGDINRTLVAWNASPPTGQTLNSRILESPHVIGEYVANLRFWGTRRIINIALTMSKRDKILELQTLVFGRNL